MTPQEALRVLGLGLDASPDTIKRTWRRKAADLHPDRHLGDVQSAKSAELAEVNAAWSVLKHFTTPIGHTTTTAVEIGVAYSARDPIVIRAMRSLARQDARRVRRGWWSAFFRGFWKGQMPERPTPLSLVLCSAVVQEGTQLSILFEAPLPNTRSAVLIPTIGPGAGGLRVHPERPRVVTSEELVRGRRTLFEPTELQKMGVEQVDVVFPSRTLNITKTLKVFPSQGLDRLYYRL